jgi:hypothetical protein
VVKQDRKARQVIAFLPVSKARTNNFYEKKIEMPKAIRQRQF